jgi:hypothetical protein
VKGEGYDLVGVIRKKFHRQFVNDQLGIDAYANATMKY